MRDNTIESLNSLLKGEQMAIEAYQRFIGDAGDQQVKTVLGQIHEDHMENSELLAKRIEELGGEPQFDVGMGGMMAGMKLAVQDAVNGTPEQILKRAYDGEDKGIAMAEKVVRTEMDPVSRQVAENVLSADHDHLKSMEDAIGRYEEGKGRRN